MKKAEYNNTTGLSILEAGILLERSLTPKVLVAAVFELCLKTQFSICKTAESKAGTAEFQLFRSAIRQKPEQLHKEERLILGILFDNFSRDMITFSEIDKKILLSITVLHKADIEEIVCERLCAKGLLTPSAKASMFRAQTLRDFFFSLLTTCFFVMSIFFPMFVWFELTDIHFLNGIALMVPFLSSLGVSMLLFVLMFKSMMRTERLGAFPYIYTTEGEKICADIEGYREYLRVAEQDRINFHESPEARERMLTQHLPFAILFGFERQWLKKL